MLVLSRKENESVLIAEGMIRITVVEIRGDKIRLGIDAPRDIDVHREEIFKAIQRGKNEASSTKPALS